jgi:hypothetical protein
MTLRLTVAPGASGTAYRPGCDFCGAAPGRWIHDANDLDFLATGPAGSGGYTSVGAWVSCDGCLLPIQRGDSDGLAERVARSNGPALVLRMTTISFRRRYFREFYRRMLRRLKPARPLTVEIADRWRSAMQDYHSDNAASARRVARALEAS